MASLRSIAQKIKGQRARPPRHQRHGFRVDARETEETCSLAMDESASAGCFIEYHDSKGSPSERTITFRSISGHYGAPETIGAYCHARERYRSFRVDRIQSMFDATTGEELDPIEHCIALHRNGALTIEDKVLTRMMRIVTFMSRCDGHVPRSEVVAIEDILGRYFRNFGGDDDAYDCAVREAPNLAPADDEFIKALKFITKAPHAAELCRFALDACGSVIDADGKHTEQEIVWSVEVSELLRATARRHSS